MLTYFRKMKSKSILPAAFVIAALLALPGCDILNDSILQEGVFIEEEEPEPELHAVQQAEPEEPGLSAWEARFAAWPIAFGFANEEGSKLIHVFYEYDDSGDSDEDAAEAPAIAPAEDSAEPADETYDEDYEPNNYFEETGFDPDAFSLAVGSYGETFPISFAYWQNETWQNNGRETAYNFGNLPGFVFRQKDWKLTRNKTYLMTDMDTLIDSMLAISPSGWRGNTPPMDDETIAAIERHKERKVEWTKTLALTKVGDGQIGQVLFERLGDDMLFSIVYIDESKMLFWDCPAEYDETSTWRADAGAEPGNFDPIILSRFPEGLLIMLTWSAPEGETTVVLYEEDGVLVQAEELYFGRYTQ